MTSIYEKIFFLYSLQTQSINFGKWAGEGGSSDGKLQNIFCILMKNRVKRENYFLFRRVFIFNQHFN